MAGPAKYRKVEDISAMRLDANNGEEMAKWANGKYIIDKAQVIIAVIHDVGNVSTVEVDSGEWLIRKDNGEFVVWTDEMFGNSGFKSFHHRGKTPTE